MSYTSMKRGMRWARRPAKVTRIHTGLGHLYRVLRFFNATRLTRLLMRKPWHIADEYVDGHYTQPLYVGSKTHMRKATVKRLKKMNELAEQKARNYQSHGSE